MYRLRITRLRLCDGTELSPGRLTVFVGPNNSGKTRALKDIGNDISGSALSQVVVTAVDFARPASFDELMKSPYALFFEPTEQGSRWYDLSIDLGSHEARDTMLRWPEGFFLLWDESIAADEKAKRAGFEGNQVKDLFGYLFATRLLFFLKTAQRLSLLQRGNLTTSDRGPQSLLEVLLRSPQEVEDRIHRQFKEAFGTDFVVDYSQLTQLRVVVGAAPDGLPEHPRRLAAALKQHVPLEEQGDGMRAFLGLLVALETIERPIVLVDEPETFLHPPQARRMGEMLAHSKREHQQVFVATHSVDTLRGILSETSDVQIVRLSRTHSKTTTTWLDPNRLAEISNDPVLSSARVLDGLFYSSAIVVEGDRDARFYQAVTDRLRARNVPYFLVAGGKQAIPKLLAEYVRLGIPVVAIVDFDVVRDRSQFLRILSEIADEKTAAGIIQHRDRLASAVEAQAAAQHRRDEVIAGLQSLARRVAASEDAAAGLSEARRGIKGLGETVDTWRDVKRRGRHFFVGEALEAACEMLDMAAKTGLFICPEGELEGFLREDTATQEKSKWLNAALRLIARYEIDVTQQPWMFVKQALDYLDEDVRQS